MNEKQIGALDLTRTEEIRNEYDKDKTNLLMRHALARNSISNVIFDSASLKDVDTKFSIDIKTLPVANQRQSGRCWIFAGLNVLREIIAKECGLSNFE